MASIFDLAAELSQFGLSDQPQENESTHAVSSNGDRYDRRHVDGAKRITASPLLMGSKAASKSKEQLENRLQELQATTTTRSAVKLQKVYAHSASYPILPRNEPQEEGKAQQQMQQLQRRQSSDCGDTDGCDPDLIAKSVLCEINDEMDQIAQVGLLTSDAGAANSMMRCLTEKYIETRLSKLSATPFVQLARRKAARKIQQLVQAQHNEPQSMTIASSSKGAATNESNTIKATNSNNSASAGDAALWNKLKVLSAQQHAMLQKLVRIPEAQVCNLPPAQQELVQFAKRYDRLLQLSENEISKLPLQHQHIVHNLQQQAQEQKRN